MSDVMFYGVLRMPQHLAMADPLSRGQFYARAQEAANRVEAADKRIAELEAKLRQARNDCAELEACLHMTVMGDAPVAAAAPAVEKGAFSCAKRSAEPGNEFAACRKHCGDCENCHYAAPVAAAAPVTMSDDDLIEAADASSKGSNTAPGLPVEEMKWLFGMQELRAFLALAAPVAAAAPNDLHAAIMNLACNVPGQWSLATQGAYKTGHRDARHAAAELVAAAAPGPESQKPPAGGS